MTIRVAKDETFVEVGFSQAGKLLVSCGAAARGVKTAIEKEVDVVGTAAMDEWRGILTTTDEMDIDQQRRARSPWFRSRLVSQNGCQMYPQRQATSVVAPQEWQN